MTRVRAWVTVKHEDTVEVEIDQPKDDIGGGDVYGAVVRTHYPFEDVDLENWEVCDDGDD